MQQWIAEVTATRAAAEVQLRDSHTAPEALTPEQVRGLLEQAGGLIDALDCSDPALRAQLYEKLGIDGVYDPDRHTVHVQAELGRRIGTAPAFSRYRAYVRTVADDPAAPDHCRSSSVHRCAAWFEPDES